ncbi:MAG: GGDEF domain-containing protein [Rhizobiales bacterium]|nr:GGDEF domain-containing protein [Hyphomicrobiales bacterium]
MSLQGSLVVVAETPAPDLVEALADAGAFPVVESRWAHASAAVIAIQPSAIVLAEPGPAPDAEAAYQLGLQIKSRSGPIVPLICRSHTDATLPMQDGLPVDAAAPTDRLVARLRSALRVRALHATVLRRAETLAAQTGLVAKFPDSDPLDDATILVAGRGGSYPALAVTVGERVGLVGALSIETAARYLAARAIDGIIIGDGFSARVVDALLTAIAEDVRFRDMPIAVPAAYATVEAHYGDLANLERVVGPPAQVLDWMLPLVRLRAFEARLKRMLTTLDAKGMLDPDTGLMTDDAFWRELSRAVSEAERSGTGLCIARFAFEAQVDRRVSFDAARLISAIVRNIDFACREADGAILVVFTETELRSAHIVTRRIATMLRSTMLVSDHDLRRPEPAITLATLKSSDTLDSLVVRVGSRVVAAA